MSTEVKRSLSLLGVPLGYGASMAGVDIGPAALRVARITQRIARLGYSVHDLGDMRLERPQTFPEVEEKLKYVREISNACEQLAIDVEEVLKAGQLPLVLGGDHSIAIGSFAGAASYYKKQNETLGLIWFDAHADMNTPESTPSGNIHGMPLATLLGYGTPELTNVAGFAPKLDPQLCAHVGARDIDPGERELIKKLGMRFFTMREIDERGMNAVMDDAIKIASRGTAGYGVTFDVDVLDPVITNFAREQLQRIYQILFSLLWGHTHPGQILQFPREQWHQSSPWQSGNSQTPNRKQGRTWHRPQ